MFFVLWAPQLCPVMRREQPKGGELIPLSAECANLQQIIPWGAGALIQTDPVTLEWLFGRYQDFLAPQWGTALGKVGKTAPKKPPSWAILLISPHWMFSSLNIEYSIFNTAWRWLAQQSHPSAVSGVRRVHEGTRKLLYKTISSQPGPCWTILKANQGSAALPSDTVRDGMPIHQECQSLWMGTGRALPRCFLCHTPPLLLLHLLCH